LKISEHAKQRYAERIENLDYQEAKRYVANNSDMICERISKMMEYAKLVYSGASIVDSNNSKDVDILINGTWILIYEKKKDTLITIYNIDLGLGKEFNDKYIDALMFKINSLSDKYEEENKIKESKIEEYKNLIKSNNDEIAYYRSKIKGLEEENNSYTILIDHIKNEITKSGEEIRQLVSTLIKKKVY
jgi:hypothetical protein